MINKHLSKNKESFNKFVKALYVFSQFRHMEGAIWECLKETIELYQDEERLDYWAENTGYYKRRSSEK